MMDDLSARSDATFEPEPSDGGVKPPRGRFVRRAVIVVLALIILAYGLIAFVRLQISAYHEEEEKKLHDAAELLERSADRLEQLPGPQSRWGIMAADQRRDARRIHENAEEHARLKQRYSAGALRPWNRVAHGMRQE
jgi:hypothetical protein